MIRCSLIASAMLALAAPAFAEAPQWRATDASTGQLTSIDDLTVLADDFPESSSVQLRLINALLEAGNTDEAGRAAVRLAARGHIFSGNATAQIAGYLDPDLADWFRSLVDANRQQVEASALLATLPPEAQLVESVTRDPASGDLYATTVVSRALWVKRGAAEWVRLDIEGAGSLSGIAYDPKAKLLWIASGNFDQTPGEKVYSALLGFDPKRGKVVRTLYANGIVSLGDVAVGDDGSVYVSDPQQGLIHQAGPKDEGLRALVGQGIFRSPQGMVAAPGGRLLIVSDYRYGLAVLDMQTGTVRRLTSDKTLMLDGIDGLARHGNNLVAVQNGTRPMRILKLKMAKDWQAIESATVLESGHRSWTEPVGGTVSGDEFLYVATGQWERFGPGGQVLQGEQPGPTDVRVLKLGK